MSVLKLLGRKPATLPILIFLWSLAWILSRHFPYLPASYDSAYYLVAAKGFAFGQPYHDFSSPDPNVGALLGPSFYPFLLSLYWRFLNPSVWILKMLTAASMALGPAMAFLWLRLWLTIPLALLISLAFGSSYMFIVVGNSFMTEVVYTPMLYLAMWFMHRRFLNDETNTRGEKLETWSALTLVVTLARTRVVGWILFLVFLFLASRKRSWKLISAGIAAAGAWIAVERILAIGVPVSRYTDTIWTKTYPFKVDFFKGLTIWWANVWQNLHGFSLSIDAHVLFPYLYGLVDMNKGKRLACLSIFIWSVWGVWVTWMRWPGIRMWMVSAGVASLPTFFIYTTNDSFRYHVPYFPFFVLFLLAPCLQIADGSSLVWKKYLPISVALVVVMSQSLHALRHDFDTEFITAPGDFKAIHDSLLSSPKRPDICLSPNNYYTYLLTDVPSFNLQGRNGLEEVAIQSQGKEVWAICGPTNDYFCEAWERQGLVFGKPPLFEVGYWSLHRIEAWPDSN